MRRQKRWTTGVILALLIGLLAACGHQENNAGTSASTAAPSSGENAGTAAASPPETSAEADSTRMFKDALGHEVAIPVNPQRIVVDQFMGHLLALGVKPAGAASYQFSASFLKELSQGIEDVGNPVSLEKVLSLKPDLIILQAGGKAVESYDAFNKIAPTVVLAYGTDAPDALEQLRQIGDIVGKKDEAEQWISKYEAKASQYRDQIAAAVGKDKTFSIMEIWAKQTVVFGKNFGRGGFNLYDTLQLSPPQKVQQEMFDKNESWKEISMESLGDYAGDYIFLTVNAGEDSAAREKEITGSKLWQSLPAVKNGRVFLMNADEFFPGDPISIDKQLDIQAKLLSALQ